MTERVRKDNQLWCGALTAAVEGDKELVAVLVKASIEGGVVGGEGQARLVVLGVANIVGEGAVNV